MGEAAHGELVVKRDLQAVAEVRRFVRLAVGRWEVDDFVPCLVASELVTNAIRYATGEDEVIFRNYEGKRFVYKQPRQGVAISGCGDAMAPAAESDVVPIQIGKKKAATRPRRRRKTGSQRLTVVGGRFTVEKGTKR